MLLSTLRRTTFRNGTRAIGRPLSSYRLVEHDVMGVRLTAEKKCMPGETFSKINRVSTDELTQHSMTDAWKGVNYAPKTKGEDHIPFHLEHNPQPNLRISADSESVVATRPIQSGDFLSIDYCATEHKLFKQFPTVVEPVLLRPWTTGSHEEVNEEGKKWLNVDTPPQNLLTSCHAEYSEEGRMQFHGIDLLDAALSYDPDTPLYLYSKQALRINLHRVSHYLHKHFERSTLFYSVKANSSAAVLCELRHAGMTRLDVCSPQEVDRGRECGFAVANMQYTGTNLSERDLKRLARHKDLKINVDSLSMLERLPLRNHVGLRLDPNVGMSYQDDERLQCTCGSKPTKMGILLSDVHRACELARNRGVNLERIHAHVGNSFQTDDLGPLKSILAQVQQAISICEDEGFRITEVNLGGGYGVPYLPGEQTFDWDAWAETIKEFPAISERHVQIEPGDSIVKNAGVLVARATDVFEKGDTSFVGLNAGMNLNPLPAYYGIASYPYPVLRRKGGTRTVSVVGNLNESVDVWQEDVDMTPVHIGDHVALLNSGGYAHSCRTNHSLRNDFNSLLV